MHISATVKNRNARHEVSVATGDSVKPLNVPCGESRATIDAFGHSRSHSSTS